MKFGYKTSGVCSESIYVEIKDGKIADRFRLPWF